MVVVSTTSILLLAGMCGSVQAATADKAELLSTRDQIHSIRHGEELIFYDDFDNLDLRTWSHEVTASGGGNWEFQWYGNNRNNSYVEDGKLHLKASLTEEFLGRRPTENFLKLKPGGAGFPDGCTDPTNWGCERTTNGENIVNPIQSAKVSTKDSFSFKYGRVEVSAKMPQGDWLWPAIWMMPRYSTYGSWPASGEIDIVESRGHIGKTRINQSILLGRESITSTLHWGPKSHENMYHLTQGIIANKTEDLSKSYHTYGLYWNSTHLMTYFDDPKNVVLTVDLTKDAWSKGNFEKRFHNTANPWRSGSAAAPFDQEFFLILNLACGGTGGFFDDKDFPNKPWKNKSPTATFDFWKAKEAWLPTWKRPQLSIDWVKVWAARDA